MTRLVLTLSSAVLLGAAGPGTAALLDTAKVWKAEIRLTADDWKAMQPKGGGPPGFGGPGGGECAKACRACAKACEDARR